MDTYNSPNFNKDTGRFQHPEGDKHNKSAGDLFDFFRAYYKREADKWESEGFPLSVALKLKWRVSEKM